MYNQADRAEIGQMVREEMLTDYNPVVINTNGDLDAAVDTFLQLVSEALEHRVRRAKPSPFAKKWWTGKLTFLRDSLSAARNHLTTVRRRGDPVDVAAAKVKLARRLYLDEIDWRKLQHWSDFLDDRDNI